MNPRKTGIAAVLAILAAGAYWWWMRPERQIQAILDDIATAFTHEGEESGLDALAAVAALQEQLAPDVSIALDSTRVEGRQQAITAAARVRAGSRMMRVRFFDPRMTFAGDASATIAVTTEVTRRTESGNDVIDVLNVTATLRKPAGRWMVSSVLIAGSEPEL